MTPAEHPFVTVTTDDDPPTLEELRALITRVARERANETPEQQRERKAREDEAALAPIREREAKRRADREAFNARRDAATVAGDEYRRREQASWANPQPVIPDDIVPIDLTAYDQSDVGEGLTESGDE